VAALGPLGLAQLRPSLNGIPVQCGWNMTPSFYQGIVIPSHIIPWWSIMIVTLVAAFPLAHNTLVAFTC
jgi:hypothetical protein